MKATILLLILAVPIAAQKIDGTRIDQWTLVAKGKPDNVKFYFAPDSIRRSGESVRGWARWDFIDGSGAFLPNTDYSSIRLFVIFDCEQNRARSEDVLFYRNGSLVRKARDNGWTRESPDTLGYAIFEYLCERRSTFPPQEPPKLRQKP